MPYTSIKRVRNGAAVLDYVLNGEGHDGSGSRNRIVTPIYMNKDIGYRLQMNKYWKRARSNHKVQIISIVQSFSQKEFDRENYEDILKANEIGQALIEEHYPGRQALICTQTDGERGLVHNHILINDVSMIDSKACCRFQYHHTYVAPWTDEIAARYTIPDFGEEPSEKLTHAEHAMQKRDEKPYKTEIRKRVLKAMKSCSSEEDFFRKLSASGVNTVKKYSKKHSEHFVYELVDTSTIPADEKLPNHKLRARSYKMGEDYGPKALKEHLEIYERVVIRSEFTGFDEYPMPKTSMGKTVSTEEKTEQQETAVLAPIDVSDKSGTSENIPQLIMDTENETSEEDEKTSGADLVHKKPVAKSKIGNKQVLKKHVKVNGNRFDSAVHMSDTGDRDHNEKDDEFEK